MLDTAILLTKEPKHALVEIINYHNSLLLETDKVRFDNITPLVGRNTRVTVVSTSGANALYTGDAEFTFNRLNLTEFFAPVTLNLTVGYPSSTFSILQKLSEMFSMVMDEEDFELHEFNSLGQFVYTLSAKSSSLRWHGSVDINVDVTVTLEDYLQVLLLNGLNEFSIATPLENLYQILALNGLTYGDFGINLSGVLTASKLNSLWVDNGLGPVIVADTSLTGIQMLKAAIQLVSINGLNPLDYTCINPLPALGDRNTTVTIIASGGSLLLGSVDVTYNRIDLTQVLTGFTPLPMEIYPEPSEVLGLINTQAGLNLEYADALATHIGGGVFTVSAKPGSFGYIGEVNITFVVEGALAGFDGDPLGGFDGDYIGGFA